MPKQRRAERLVYHQFWSWLCIEIIWRSHAYARWCRRNKRLLDDVLKPPYHRAGRAIADPKLRAVNAFLNIIGGRRAVNALRMFRFLNDEKTGKRGMSISRLMPQADTEEDDWMDSNAGHSMRVREDGRMEYRLSPLERMLSAYDMWSYGLSIMEITRYFFPEAEGRNPTYDETADRLRLNVRRWIHTIHRLVRQVDSSSS